jgi:hypothetical protein
MIEYLIFYLDRSGWLRAARTFSMDRPYQVRLDFLSDYPAAQEIVDFRSADDRPKLHCS